MAISRLPDDILREILLRLNEAADLFRCGTACKRWCGLVTDPSFLLRRWPRPSLAGLVIKYRGRYQGDKVLVPTPSSELGTGRRRALSSFVPGASARQLLHDAIPLLSSRGLLLVRLVSSPRSADSNLAVFHLAVCNLLAGTCHKLLPIELDYRSLSIDSSDERSGCAIVTGPDDDDDQEPPGNSPSSFKVIIVTVNCTNCLKLHINTFSSHEASWSPMRTICFSGTIHRNAHGSFCHTDAVVSNGGIAHWLFFNGTPPCLCLVKLDARNGHVSFTRLSGLVMARADRPRLSLAIDDALSVLQMQATGSQVEIWKQQDQEDHITSEWLRTHTIYLMQMQPRKDTQRRGSRFYILAEKCSKLLVKDDHEHVYTADLRTGAMEKVVDWPRMRPTSTSNVVPLEMDWPAFFLSRLGTVSGGKSKNNKAMRSKRQQEDSCCGQAANG